MKLAIPLFATAALAWNPVSQVTEHLYRRALTDIAQTMINDLNNIRNQTTAVTKVIQAFDGSSLNAALPINAATANVISAINNATADAKRNPQNLTSAGAQALAPVTQELSYAANQSIAALIAKKADFSKLDLDAIVLQSLQQQLNVSAVFSGLLIPKIPADTRPVAVALNSGLGMSLQMGIDCFSGKNASCNPTPVNASRTYDSALQDGAAVGAAGRTVGAASATVVSMMAFLAVFLT
ncbi:Hypothetical predicted protein [Lecanosticta acicola]|uniref:Cell wall galactomannoprotein n=1 Tax=Lecanosticta acicola TaxID=111012 RepID=A0AAI9EFC0_9PEZI|nr:Hypothetical predicted protein [Lecanosticta acicola]